MKERVIAVMTSLGYWDDIGKTSDNLDHYFGMDRLDHVELIMEIEKEFNIHIPDDTAEGFKTLDDIIDYLEGL